MLPLRARRDQGRLKSWKVCRSALERLLFFSWETEVFNEPFFNWGSRHSRCLRLWFSLGVGVGLLLVVTIVTMVLLWVLTLFVNLDREQITSGSTQQNGQIFTIVVPGINVPWSEFPYMIVATTVAVGLHELGHTMAAASEGVPIEHIAIFLACVIPGAVVALNQQSLQLLTHMRALRIYCAGVWHNVVCCAGCYLLLMLLPVILSPLYVQNQHPVVSNVDAMSPLAGHLKVGDSIVSVAGLQVRSPEDWLEVLHNLNVQGHAYLNLSSNANIVLEGSSKFPQHIAAHGFCGCSEDITKHDNRLYGAVCPDDALLFYHHSCNSAIPSGTNLSQNIYCLKAADVVKCPSCNMKQNSEATALSCSCLGDRSCIFPLLNQGEVLVAIEVQQTSLKPCSMKPFDSGCKHDIVFVGDLESLFYSLELTKYRPRVFLSAFVNASWLALPKTLERFLLYAFSISAAMALLNSAPVYYLDGEVILRALLACTKPRVHPRQQKKIMRVTLAVGTTFTVSFFTIELMKTLF